MVVSAAEEHALIVKVLTRLGAGAEEAAIVADVLVDADLCGRGSHGLVRFPQIVDRLQARQITPNAPLTLLREHGATALVDGGQGFGQPVALRAMQLAMTKALQLGVGAVGVRNANHFGRAGYYVERAAEAGLVGLVVATTPPLVHPHGGVERVLGTNPLAIGAPSAGEFPIVLDMATSEAAIGKIIAAREAGTPIPAGWAVRPDGSPSTDPAVAYGDALSPFGRAKGFALAFLIGILAGPLVGGEIGQRVTGDVCSDAGGAPASIGFLFLALNPAAFGDPDDFRSEVAAFARQVVASRPAPGATIRVPGEKTWHTRRQRLRAGISHPDSLWRRVQALLA